MKVLITGGAGYIGTQLIYKLSDAPEISEVVIYDNLSRSNFNLFLGRRKLDHQKIKFIKGDLLDSRKLSRYVERADIVIHLAAKVSTPFADRNPHGFDQVNNWGTSELVRLVEDSSVKKFIYASSLSVYGSSEDSLNIQSTLAPKTFYGISKKNGESHVARLLEKEMSTYILRLGNVYGYSKSMRFDSVINKFMFEANFYRRLNILGDGHQVRSFIHVNRLSTVLTDFIFKDIQQGHYNVVESTYSVNEVVDTLKEIYPDLEMIYVNQNMPMRSLNVGADPRITSLNILKDQHLLEDLTEFKSRFTF